MGRGRKAMVWMIVCAPMASIGRGLIACDRNGAGSMASGGRSGMVRFSFGLKAAKLRDPKPGSPT